jgi:DNA polymerase
MCKRHRIVYEEPHRSELCFLGEGPGGDEDRKGIPFCGRAGSEYSHLYLPLAGCSRLGVYTSNAVKCMTATSGKAPSGDLVACCSTHWFPWELRRVRPSILVTMGGTALSLFPGHDLELEHGRPFQGSLNRPTKEWPGEELYWEGTVFPTYHPAAGLHASEFMTPLMDDFRALGRFLRGTLALPIDEFPNPDYALCRGYGQAYSYLEAHHDWAIHNSPHWHRPVIGRDTETTPPLIEGAPQDPFCTSFSLHPGTGRAIAASDDAGLQAYRDWKATHNPLELWHNGLFDLPVSSAMDLPVLPGEWRDTMVMAYNQATLPKGLKVLAYRQLGVRMLEFEDLVRPWWLLKVVEYLGKVAAGDWEYLRKPKQVGLGKRTARIVKDLGPDLSGETNPKERWEAIPDEMRQAAEQVHGAYPAKSIALVAEAEWVPYACRDADVALRLYFKELMPRMVPRLKPVNEIIEVS